MNKAACGTFLLCVVLTTAALASCALPAVGDSEQHPQLAIGFQRMTGGLGGGTEINPSRCRMGFDPRQNSQCDWELGLLPGGGLLCPCHATSVFQIRRSVRKSTQQDRISK